jgi:aldose 1-epimerase
VPFGIAPDGTPVHAYSLTDESGMEARVIDWGACLQSLRLADGTHVVLGFDTFEAYVAQRAYMGSTVGRYANRIANATFELDGERHWLSRNEGPHHLHGGARGLDQVPWRAIQATRGGLKLEHVSQAGDQGYPGTLRATARFALEGDASLCIDYAATSDRATVVNLSNHAYFNLRGGGDILQHRLRMAASRFLPVDGALVPTGEIRDVERTPMDFRSPAAIGARLDADYEQLNVVAKRCGQRGYDHNWVLDKHDGVLDCAASVLEPDSGRTMDILSTQPGLQFYSGHLLDGSLLGSGGARYHRYAGFCLEPQHFPDSPNRPQFPSTVLRPGCVYRQTIVYRFGRI